MLVIKWFIVILFLTILNSCGGIDENNAVVSDLSAYNGTWVVTGQTQVASPEKVGDCGYGIGGGDLAISGNTVEGEFTDNSGFSYVVEGTIDASGKMAGAFTYAGYDAATFEGNLSALEGKGTWKDIYDCPGFWQVKKKDQNPDQLAENSS